MSIEIFSEKTAKRLSWVGLLSIVLGALVFVFFRSWSFSWVINEEKVAQFGDFIGGVVGSILAFVGVILYYIALTEQRKDIAINRQALETQVSALEQQITEFKTQTTEMQETRTVYQEQTNLFREQTNLYREQTEYYKQQVKELKDQTKISSLQHFNSEFYSLLNVFLSIKGLCKDTITETIKELNKAIISMGSGSIFKKHTHLVNKYTDYYYNNANSLSIYFKTLFRLLKMIEDSNMKKEDKEAYAKTLRSQLSDNELLIIYYDLCSNLGNNLKLLASKYNLLVDLNLLSKIEFDIQAFKNNKASIITYLSKLYSLLDSAINSFRDLENDDDSVVNGIHPDPFIGKESTYRLSISDDNFTFEIKIKKENLQIEKEELKNLFLSFLYDYFFLSKLKRPIESVFDSQIDQTDQYLICKFMSEPNNLL